MALDALAAALPAAADDAAGRASALAALAAHARAVVEAAPVRTDARVWAEALHATVESHARDVDVADEQYVMEPVDQQKKKNQLPSAAVKISSQTKELLRKDDITATANSTSPSTARSRREAIEKGSKPRPTPRQKQQWKGQRCAAASKQAQRKAKVRTIEGGVEVDLPVLGFERLPGNQLRVAATPHRSERSIQRRCQRRLRKRAMLG